MEGVIIGDGRRCGSLLPSMRRDWFSINQLNRHNPRSPGGGRNNSIIIVHYGLKLHGGLGIICCLYISSYSDVMFVILPSLASIIRCMSILHAMLIDVTIVADSCLRGTSDIVQLNLMWLVQLIEDRVGASRVGTTFATFGCLAQDG
eukprot:scaffold5077_cov162-Skeletonema_dohrnii-CCMP3373.AAC.1